MTTPITINDLAILRGKTAARRSLLQRIECIRAEIARDDLDDAQALERIHEERHIGAMLASTAADYLWFAGYFAGRLACESEAGRQDYAAYAPAPVQRHPDSILQDLEAQDQMRQLAGLAEGVVETVDSCTGGVEVVRAALRQYLTVRIHGCRPHNVIHPTTLTILTEADADRARDIISREPGLSCLGVAGAPDRRTAEEVEWLHRLGERCAAGLALMGEHDDYAFERRVAAVGRSAALIQVVLALTMLDSDVRPLVGPIDAGPQATAWQAELDAAHPLVTL